jgi:hypothetical protein
LPAQQALSDHGTGAPGRSGLQSAQAPAIAVAQEDAPERLTSRLSGLRSLLTGLGLREVHPSVGTTEGEHPQRTSPASGSVAAEVSSRGLQSIRQSSPLQDQAASTGTREIPAQPEFLKPVATGQEYRAGDANVAGRSSVRTFQTGTEFEMPTLPAKRGQYRNL